MNPEPDPYDKYNKAIDDVTAMIQEKYPEPEKIEPVVIVAGNLITLQIGELSADMTPEQAVELMQELRRAVVKIKPKALYPKHR